MFGSGERVCVGINFGVEDGEGISVWVGNETTIFVDSMVGSRIVVAGLQEESRNTAAIVREYIFFIPIIL
jgi:hypothetical protein